MSILLSVLFCLESKTDFPKDYSVLSEVDKDKCSSIETDKKKKGRDCIWTYFLLLKHYSKNLKHLQYIIPKTSLVRGHFQFNRPALNNAQPGPHRAAGIKRGPSVETPRQAPLEPVTKRLDSK